MYERMGQRDLCRKMCTASAIAAFCFLWLWGVGALDWSGLYGTLLCAVVFIVSLIRYRRVKGGIMPVRNCFLRMEEDWLIVCQPGRDGQYEECEIFLSEIGQIVPGNGWCAPSFYIVLMTGAEKSRIGAVEKAGRRIFCVQGEWYGKKEFLAVYRALCRILPDNIRQEAMEMPAGWKHAPVDVYGIFLWMLPALFLLPLLCRFL